ncbi:hypothetical protein B4N89_30350 [Embleya scabrispora]|uniref:GNAT family N-acetyltransferase n=2 Tax=Embleya scabrispora TaxID=159449 RepID=A0A1T3P8J1_9ACTN|nr:hypothetical protein B4N89_30350 [Embleya scabrispora]
MLDSTASGHACARFLCEVWQTEPDRPPLAGDVVKAMADAGSYVAGAFDEADGDARLLGACVGLWGPPGRPGMHSHIAGVHVGARGRDVGYALKLDQRAHALEHGVDRITWTFDPLVARNAHFNLHKLGGTADTYLPDYYGPLSDGLNAADESDRLMLRWDLRDERVVAACDEDDEPTPTPASAGPTRRTLLDIDGDRPVTRQAGEGTVLVAIPPDIDLLRARQPSAARDWRLALRDTLGNLLADGARLVDFDRAACAYVLTRGEGR